MSTKSTRPSRKKSRRIPVGSTPRPKPTLLVFVRRWVTRLRVFYTPSKMFEQDRALEKAVGRRRDGSGTFLLTGERDLDWEMRSVRVAEAAAKRCVALGFVSDLSITRSPRVLLAKAKKGRRLSVRKTPSKT